MNVGEMKQRIIIEKKTETTDGVGGFTAVWSTHVTVFARVESVSGNERKFAGRLQEEITHVITCRSKSVLNTTAEMRVSFQNRLFQIKSVFRKNELSEWTTILAVEGVGT